MKKPVTLLLALLTLLPAAAQQTELTSQEAKNLYKTTTKKRISIHDPSVVYNATNQRYYIFGSHKAGAYTTDLQNWTQANPRWQVGNNTNAANSAAFVTPAVTKVVKGGEEVDFPAFNAVDWSARTDASYSVDGNMWAPDVIWNPTMQKWCMYLSINGDAWHSSIILLTADQITGPYLYQGPVVICGFYDAQHSYKDTDLELVIGQQASLPSRYNMGDKWGNRWPHTIDPAVFFDEEGRLWLVYGSWSGGIWMLELDETTGLRDYDVTYASAGGSTDAVTSDPYFGKKVGGGRYVSGEGPYIEHIGQYYYLFVSYGFYSPDGGYEMRVFRSENPNGPYRDAAGRSSIFSTWAKNYGDGTNNNGEKLMGAYSGWGFQTVGECAQGHNSVIAAEDGRTYLVYHTKFNDGTVGHQVRVHQLFLNKNGWPVAAPFEYNGEQTTDQDIASRQLVPTDDIPGTYQLLVHKYKMDYANMEEVTPVSITLTADGRVSGAYTGTWSLDPGTSYLTIKLGATTYNGVLIDEVMDGRSIHAVAFSAMATSGVNVWGYKMAPKYALAWQLNNQNVPVADGKTVNTNVDLYQMWQGDPNVGLAWSSSRPDIISNHGRYNPTGLHEDTEVTLTARLTSGSYYWEQQYTVTALSEENARPATDEWAAGMLAHYGFDDDALANTLNSAEQAQLLRKSTTKVPQLEQDSLRNGSYVHLNFGANGKESYVAMPNPLYGRQLDEGATLAFWLKRTDANLWDAIYGLVAGSARLYMTGNVYTGFNDGAGNWLDINHPDKTTANNLTVGEWVQVTIVFQRTATSTTGGVSVYINGARKSGDLFNGSVGGKTVSTKAGFDYNLVVDHLAASPELYLGYGSFWGSADACFDDVIVCDQPLKALQVMYLNRMMNRVFNFGTLTSGIEEIKISNLKPQPSNLYDLQGRRVSHPQRGLYIVNGKKQIIR